MRVHHLNCGTFCPLGEKFINGTGSPLGSGKLVCHCFLIESEAGLILVDTGLGTRDLEAPMESLPGPFWQAINRAQLDPDETAIHQIQAMGLNPYDVRHIVLTHLDFDHAGGLSDFPQAKVHVLATEHEAAMHPSKWIDHERYAKRQFVHQPDWALHMVEGERWFDFEAVRTLPGIQQEILLVPLAGHSRGHCGVAVQTPSGWLLHCGDAFFHHEEMRPDERRCPPGLRAYQNVFQDDRKLRLHNQERLRELARTQRDKVRMVCSHDPDMLEPLQVTTRRTNNAYIS